MGFANELKNNQGISLVTLTITIMVILIIVAITIFEGHGTVEKGELTRFLVEFSNLETAFNANVNDIYAQYLKNGYDVDFDKIYYMSAKNITDINSEISSDTLDPGVEFVLNEAGIKGNQYYEIQTSIPGYQKQSPFVEIEEHIYVTNEGDIFIIPPFEGIVMGEPRYYFNSKKYVKIEE